MMPNVAKTKISNRLGRLENEEEQIKWKEGANQGQNHRMLKKRRVAVILYKISSSISGVRKNRVI